jgi:hypothetical protein
VTEAGAVPAGESPRVDLEEPAMENTGSSVPGYVLQEHHVRLIDAAIRLGDTLMRLPEATQRNKDDISRFQEVLRRLPASRPGAVGEYSFFVGKLDIGFVGVNREWFVFLGRGGVIEIGAIYTTVPHGDCVQDSIHEDWFMFEPGQTHSSDDASVRRWAEEVADPNRWRRPDQDFEIGTDFTIEP